MISSSDISLVLSGGNSNQDPTASLGGDPSSYPVSQTNTENNLFSNIVSYTATQSIDYRCVYFFNDNTSDSLYDAFTYLIYQTPEDTVMMGVSYSNEVQSFQVSGNPGLIATLRLENSTPLQWVLDNDPNIMALQLRGGLQTALPTGGTVTVSYIPLTGGSSADGFTFVATWSDFRYHRLTEVFSTDAGVTCTITRTQGGSPINTVAPSVTTGAPPNVSFKEAIMNDNFYIGTLLSGDGFPLWIQRETPMNLELTNAKCAIRLSGNSSPSSSPA